MYKYVITLIMFLLANVQESNAFVTVTMCVHVDLSSGERIIYEVHNGFRQCGSYSASGNSSLPAHFHATAQTDPVWFPPETEPTHPSCRIEANQSHHN